ncbi:MAG: 23S rRNA (uracil(1939)-C(5))-methyltransferase RlmD [unclassified Hahellaceae]|nr:23S rRNA (uracil(1939)-C(5))-methyltransferase RlmD [Hahellaceae bacterium]|tara:strand:+ start:12713 stop:14098 length:1386 start_codon:yes stop_codon:yes gene_type:complete
MSKRRVSKRKPDPAPVQLTIESLSHEGRGVARLDGKTQFVDGALPGEVVMARRMRAHRTFDDCATIEVLEPSPDRIEPFCPHAKLCGGCSLQYMPQSLQLEHKQAVVLELFKHAGAEAPKVVAPPLRSAPSGYRSKARMGARYVFKKEETLVGFREQFSSFLADITQCPILVPAVGERITELRACLSQLSVRQAVPQVEVAAGENAVILIIRHLEPLTNADIELLEQFGRDHDFLMYGQAKGPDTVKPLASYLDPEKGADPAGELFYELPAFDLTMQFRPTDFTQVNMPLNREMLSQAMAWLQPQAEDSVLDLFCGLGNFTLPLARLSAQVTGVEGSLAMTAQAEHNARKNGIDNVSFAAGDLFDIAALRNADGGAQWIRHYDKVLLDPPRAGAEDVVRSMGLFSPSAILYVSCNPATLARDAAILNAQGYRLRTLGIMDMFPQTAHVESMALFEKAGRSR